MAAYRDRPTIISEGGVSNGRVGPYGESYTLPLLNPHQVAADEGSNYVAVNPTAGTGILGHAAPTTFDDAKPFLLLYNSGDKRVFLNSILLVTTVVGVGHTRDQFNFQIDAGNRYSSAGTTLTVSNVNMDSTNTSGVNAYAGAVVATAASSSRRLLGNYVIKGANIEVVWDQIEFVFGAPQGNAGGFLTPTTTACHFRRQVPPVVLGPTDSFLMTQWAASQSTGPTYEVIVNFTVR